MTINERFGKIIRILYGGNKSAFASAIGVTPSVVDNITGKRQGNPSFEVIEKVSALAEVNIEWLITGKGEAFDFRSEEERRAQDIRRTSEVEIKLIEMLSTKDDTIRQQAEDIGRLKERINQLERRMEKTAGGANIEHTANAG